MERLAEMWPHLTATAVVLLSLGASGHAVLYKRDPRSAIGWVGFIWVAPVIGAIFYILLGINRIKRRAAAILGDRERMRLSPTGSLVSRGSLETSLTPDRIHIASLFRLVNQVARRPVVGGNRITPLRDGDAAYPAMIAAIEGATTSVSLCTYIFDNDRAGRQFRDALAAAKNRGVEVRVLVDAAGARYSFPTIEGPLKRAGIRVARFLPTVLPWRLPYMNLRNHRKILVIDGRIGFTGGMNIRTGHVLQPTPAHPVHDLHFRIDGPVVGHLQEVFAEDWRFQTRELLAGPAWFPPLVPQGQVLARGISDGPDEEFGKLRWALLGAIASARSSIQIVTPYFLPDASTITSLNVAAMRGVRVDILLPENNNLFMVKWASQAHLWQVLEGGCRVHMVSGVFDHTKLMIVDRQWSLIGSANWDPRSLRLNFELNVECYDEGLADELSALVQHKLFRSRPVTLEEVDARGLGVRLRDGIARLFTPYL